MDDNTRIFVVGFVTDSGTGGFEWDTDKARIVAYRDQLVADGDCDVSAVLDVTLEQLNLDGQHTNEAVTDALNQWPVWEPAEGEGRTDTVATPA